MNIISSYISKDAFRLTYGERSIIYRNYNIGINKKVELYSDIFNFMSDIPIIIISFDQFNKKYKEIKVAINEYNKYVSKFISKRLNCPLSRCEMFFIKPELY